MPYEFMCWNIKWSSIEKLALIRGLGAYLIMLCFRWVIIRGGDHSRGRLIVALRHLYFTFWYYFIFHFFALRRQAYIYLHVIKESISSLYCPWCYFDSWLVIIVRYRKIPNISPGLIEVRKHFFGAYIWGAYIRGPYIRKAFCVSIWVSIL